MKGFKYAGKIKDFSKFVVEIIGAQLHGKGKWF